MKIPTKNPNPKFIDIWKKISASKQFFGDQPDPPDLPPRFQEKKQLTAESQGAMHKDASEI